MQSDQANVREIGVFGVYVEEESSVTSNLVTIPSLVAALPSAVQKRVVLGQVS